MSQIWLKVREDMRNILQYCVVLVTYHNSFLNFFPQYMANFVYFQKTSFEQLFTLDLFILVVNKKNLIPYMLTIDLFTTNLLLFGKISHESGIKNKISRNKVIFKGFDQCCCGENFLFSLKIKISFQHLQRFFVEKKKP
jgi:hypothetical protein